MNEKKKMDTSNGGKKRNGTKMVYVTSGPRDERYGIYEASVSETSMSSDYENCTTRERKRERASDTNRTGNRSRMRTLCKHFVNTKTLN